jgi:hypothetical protein
VRAAVAQVVQLGGRATQLLARLLASQGPREHGGRLGQELLRRLVARPYPLPFRQGALDGRSGERHPAPSADLVERPERGPDRLALAAGERASWLTGERLAGLAQRVFERLR